MSNVRFNIGNEITNQQKNVDNRNTGLPKVINKKVIPEKKVPVKIIFHKIDQYNQKLEERSGQIILKGFVKNVKKNPTIINNTTIQQNKEQVKLLISDIFKNSNSINLSDFITFISRDDSTKFNLDLNSSVRKLKENGENVAYLTDLEKFLPKIVEEISGKNLLSTGHNLSRFLDNIAKIFELGLSRAKDFLISLLKIKILIKEQDLLNQTAIKEISLFSCVMKNQKDVSWFEKILTVLTTVNQKEIDEQIKADKLELTNKELISKGFYSKNTNVAKLNILNNQLFVIDLLPLFFKKDKDGNVPAVNACKNNTLFPFLISLFQYSNDQQYHDAILDKLAEEMKSENSILVSYLKQKSNNGEQTKKEDFLFSLFISGFDHTLIEKIKNVL